MEIEYFTWHAEWMTRHKHENHVVLIGSNRPIKGGTHFSGVAPTVELTANTPKMDTIPSFV